MSAGLVLASGSPRRAEILRTLGFSFEVRSTDTDESRHGHEMPRDYVARVAVSKGAACVTGPGVFVLSADTIVVIDGELLGKPTDAAAARGMLRMLAGRSHEVLTAVALHRDGALVDICSVRTRVHFRPLTVETVERYVAGGEGSDKAGAYAIQGLAAGFVTSIEGSYSNVVGLPAAETVALLERHGAIASWP